MIVQVWLLPYASGHPGLKTHKPSTWQGPSTWNEGWAAADGGYGGKANAPVEATAGRKRAPKASPMLASEAGIVSHPRRKLASDSHIGTFAGTVAASFLRRGRRVVRAALRSQAGAEGSGVSVAEDSSVVDTWQVSADPLFEDEAMSLASDGGGWHPA